MLLYITVMYVIDYLGDKQITGLKYMQVQSLLVIFIAILGIMPHCDYSF